MCAQLPILRDHAFISLLDSNCKAIAMIRPV